LLSDFKKKKKKPKENKENEEKNHTESKEGDGAAKPEGEEDNWENLVEEVESKIRSVEKEDTMEGEEPEEDNDNWEKEAENLESATGIESEEKKKTETELDTPLSTSSSSVDSSPSIVSSSHFSFLTADVTELSVLPEDIAKRHEIRMLEYLTNLFLEFCFFYPLFIIFNFIFFFYFEQEKY
jgi:hypothetical protein